MIFLSITKQYIQNREWRIKHIFFSTFDKNTYLKMYNQLKGRIKIENHKNLADNGNFLADNSSNFQHTFKFVNMLNNQ